MEEIFRNLKPLGYQQLTVSSTAVALTLPATGIVRMAVMVVETDAIRYRDDGTSPTASVGMPVASGGGVIVYNAAISKFKAIRQTNDAKLNISYYGDA